MAIREMLEYQIDKQTNIAELIHLRDVGLTMIQNDPDTKGTLDSDDINALIALINNKIAQLQAT